MTLAFTVNRWNLLASGEVALSAPITPTVVALPKDLENSI
jgi:hypothetical protein